MTDKAKKEHLRNGKAKATHSTSLTPDIRRRSPRGKHIAIPICNTSNESPEPNLKKRQWSKRTGNKSKEIQAPQKSSPQHHKTIPAQQFNDYNKSADTNSTTPKHPQSKKQRRSKPSTPKSSIDMTPTNSSTRVTRSQIRRQNYNDSHDTNSTPTKTETLVVPRKHHIKQTSTITTTLSALEESDEDNKDTVECPYCLKTISLVDSKVLAKAYNDIKQKDKAYHGQPPPNPRHDSGLYENFALPVHYKQRQTRRPVALMEQYSFCQLHNIELVIKPRGIELGWPTMVRFDALKKRIPRFKKELDMIIAKELDSSYRKMALEAYNGMGKHQARSVLGRMSWFEKTLPGYYGIKGASIIQKQLARMYLHPGKLGFDVTTPQTGMEYLQQVLIPEVGFRLIREDMIKKGRSKRNDPDIDDRAKSVMLESVSFGSYLQPLDLHDSVSSDEE